MCMLIGGVVTLFSPTVSFRDRLPQPQTAETPLKERTVAVGHSEC